MTHSEPSVPKELGSETVRKMSNNHCCDEETASKLLSLIRPYYKGLRAPGAKPEFKKSLKGDEVENLLLTLYDIVVDLKEREEHCGSS